MQKYNLIVVLYSIQGCIQVKTLSTAITQFWASGRSDNSRVYISASLFVSIHRSCSASLCHLQCALQCSSSKQVHVHLDVRVVHGLENNLQT